MKAKTLLTTRQTAQALRIGLRHVLTLLYEGKLPGAKKERRVWVIPASAVEARLKAPAENPRPARVSKVNAPDHPLAYTVGECADALRVSKRTIRRAIAAGKLHAVRVGRLVRVPADSLCQFIEGTQSNDSQSNLTVRANGRTDVRNSKEYARETQEQQP